MKKFIKWFIIGSGIFFLLIAVSLIIIPKFVNVEKYKPYIEKKVSKAIGRQFSINGNLKLSLFPWAGLSFTDLSIGNPPGFKEKNLLTIKSFKVKMKLLPLISRKIEVKDFVIDDPRLFLEKQNKGIGNWEGIGTKSKKISLKEKQKKIKRIEQKSDKDEFPIKSLFVNKIAIKNGFILFKDDVNGDRKEISDLSFTTNNVSLDKPVDFLFKAKIDGYLMSVTGKAGAFLKKKKQLPVNLTIKFVNLINLKINGQISDPLKTKKFDLKLSLSPFSPKKLMAAVGYKFPIQTSDPSALTSMDMNASINGDSQNLSISKCIINIDKSKIDLSAEIKEFSKPWIKFNFNLNQIDIDKYLPVSQQTDANKAKEKPKPLANTNNANIKHNNYAALEKLVLNGKINIEKIKVKKIKMEKLYMKIAGKKGIFHIDPVSFNLYNGNVLSNATINLSNNIPRTIINLKSDKIEMGPLLNDFMEKNILEGTLKSDINLTMTGDDTEKIKSNLNGKGTLIFADGAIVGVDIPGMIYNLKASFGLTEKNKKKSRTDFSELKAPFTIKNGIVDTSGTTMVSPVLRVKITGKADLNKENMNLRVEPKFVATLKGQGDTKKRSGITVPIIVSGNFDSPKFRPDYKDLLKANFGKSLPNKNDLKNLIKGKGTSSIKVKSIKKEIGGIISNFLNSNRKKKK